MKPGLLGEQIAVAALQKNFIALGSGWHYPDLAAIAPETIVLDAYPNAKDIAALAVAAFARGEQLSVLDAQPVYLRDTVSWQKRQRIRSAPIAGLE